MEVERISTREILIICRRAVDVERQTSGLFVFPFVGFQISYSASKHENGKCDWNRFKIWRSGTKKKRIGYLFFGRIILPRNIENHETNFEKTMLGSIVQNVIVGIVNAYFK